MYTKGKPLLPTTLQLFTPHLLHSVTFRHSWGWKCIEKPKNTTQFLCFCVSIFNSICDHDFPTINSTFYFLVCCSLLLFSSNAMKLFFLRYVVVFHGILPKFLLKAFLQKIPRFVPKHGIDEECDIKRGLLLPRNGGRGYLLRRQ